MQTVVSYPDLDDCDGKMRSLLSHDNQEKGKMASLSIQMRRSETGEEDLEVAWLYHYAVEH